MTRRRSAAYLPALLLCAGSFAFPGTPAMAAPEKSAHKSIFPDNFPKPDINGTVTKPDGTPAVGAKVIWYEGNADGTGPATAIGPAPTTFTNDQGRFHFDGKTVWNLEGRNFIVIVQADGFAAAFGSIRFSSYKDLSGVMPVDITLAPATEMHLRFLDPQGKPASGIAVRLGAYFKDMNAMQIPVDFPGTKMVSAADGTMTFKDLPAGWVLSYGIENPEYAQLQYPDSQVNLNADTRTQWTDIRLAKAASLSGVVVTPDGKPVAKAGIQAHTISEPERYGNAQTDENGHFTIKQMSAGDYMLMVTVPDPYNKVWGAHEVTVSLPAGTQKTGVKISLVKGAIITGHVAYRDGKVASGIGISVMRLTANVYNGVAYGATDASGNYRVCAAGGYLGVQVNVTGTRAPIQNVTVDDGKSKIVNFTIDPPIPPSMIQGVVVDSDGKPVANAEVDASLPGYQSPPPPIHSGSDGKFSLTVQDAPIVYLRARKGDSVTLKDFPALNGDNVTLKVQANVLATITGKVVDTDGKPIAGATVTPTAWHIHSGDGMDAVKSDDGGLYKVADVAPGYRYSVRAEAQGFSSESLDQLLPQPGQALTADNIVLKHTNSFVGGHVVDSHGTPLANADITSMFDRSKQAKTDKQGKFHMDGVAPGDVVLEVRKGDEWANMQVKAGKEDNVIRTYSQIAQQKQMDTQPKPVDFVGKYAPEFNVEKWVNVSPVSMSDLKGKIIIFDFWGCCADNMFETQQLAQQFASRGVIAIGLNVAGGKLEDVQAHIAKEHLTMPIAIDKDTARALGDGGYECYSIVGRDGKIAYAGCDSNEMSVAFGKLLAAEK